MVGSKRNRLNKARSRRLQRHSGPDLFVNGGFLADFSPDSTPPAAGGRNPNNCRNANSTSASRSGNSDHAAFADMCGGIDPNNNRKGKSKSALRSLKSDRGKLSGSRGGARHSGVNAFGYVYPVVDYQDASLSNVGNNAGNIMDELQDVLVDCKETQICAFVDNTPSTAPQKSQVTYDYTASFILDDKPCIEQGLYEEAIPSGIRLSLQTEEKEDSGPYSSSSEEEVNVDASYVHEVSAEVTDDSLPHTTSPAKNSGFLAIGGMKFYTEDIQDEDDEEELLDGKSSGSSNSRGSPELSESNDSEDSLHCDSDIDEEIANDYSAGVGWSDMVDLNKYAEKGFELLDDNTISGSICSETLEKLGGIALQDASREYGMKKSRSRKKINMEAARLRTTAYAWSSALDDNMLVKDPRTIFARKKRVAQFPQSWPGEGQRNKNCRRYPGEKKQHRKEMIAVKRRERMLSRGVDLGQINMKLQQVVLDGVDMFSFHPLHSKDCSQVRRLASIYGLQSVCQGYGKKRFVTVTRTQHTCMPSSMDSIRLEKLIVGGGVDADLSITSTESGKGDKNMTKKSSKGSSSLMEAAESSKTKSIKNGFNHHGSSETIKKKRNCRSGSYAQPIAFVSSGVVQSDAVEIETAVPKETKSVDNSANYGAFELHTTGFGSKMMAKMGFVEGSGLGKEGQGMTQPIEAIQRPKALGLGAEASGTSGSLPKNEHKKPVKDQTQSFGSFEKHTKGFGSMMMAKMGFVEGMGLGKDSQGISNPLVALKFPKSRGLGSKV